MCLAVMGSGVRIPSALRTEKRRNFSKAGVSRRLGGSSGQSQLQRSRWSQPSTALPNPRLQQARQTHATAVCCEQMVEEVVSTPSTTFPVLLRSTCICPDGSDGGQVSRNRYAGHIWSRETSAEAMKQHTTNEAEFRAMYDLCFDSVARYCLRRLPEHSAQDAVSDVFLTAWRRFDSIPPGGPEPSMALRGCQERGPQHRPFGSTFHEAVRQGQGSGHVPRTVP